ncbi:hypothetical protein TRSC58_00407 [Trypanosoma rangeli SC58]|uniref:Uncharacterized protein n=1 Tax=Trypanosoma rangeli SC58 TaxID=429131 RepID=A0A061JAA6_TRYRA|nr:hypothetical protein TRSC58_00407 [Trypanosoma rangeli SC58]
MAGAAPRDGQEEPRVTNSRDAFTLTLLRHVASRLGAHYTGDSVDTSDSIVVDELGRIKAEIRSRERVLGIENMGLIPLYVKAGDLSPTSEDSLRFYKKAVDVVEANKELKGHSTMMKDVTVSSFAELGSRFFRYGEYHLAEKLFTMTASICHDKSAGVCWTNSLLYRAIAKVLTVCSGYKDTCGTGKRVQRHHNKIYRYFFPALFRGRINNEKCEMHAVKPS